MIDVKNFLTKMILTWIRRLYSTNTSFQEATFALLPRLKNLDKVGSERYIFFQSRIGNDFWKDVLKHFVTCAKKLTPSNLDEFNAEFIFCNSNIQIDNRSVIYYDWIDNNIYQIYHLLDDEGNFLSFTDFVNKFHFINTNFVQYQGMIRAINVYKNKLQIEQNEEFKEQRQVLFQYIFNGNRKVNEIFVDYSFMAVNLAKWNIVFQNIDWKKVFEKCHQTTLDCKLKWMQYRIIYRVIPTNRFLFIRKIKDDSLCEHCGKEEETLKHMFFSCEHVHLFWGDLHKLLIEKCNHIINLNFSEELIFFGVKEFFFTDKVFDLILLLAKYYLYSLKWSKCKPCIKAFHNQLKNRYIVEKYNAASMNQLANFNTLWYPYMKLIE